MGASLYRTYVRFSRGRALLRGPGEERAPFPLRESRLGLDRVEVAPLARPVALPDEDGADEPAVQEIERAVPALVAVDLHLGLDVVAVLGREPELGDGLAAEHERRVLGHRVELLAVAAGHERRHVVRGQLAVGAGAVPGAHAVVLLGD